MDPRKSGRRVFRSHRVVVDQRVAPAAIHVESETIAAARAELAREIAPIDDFRSTARYRLRVAQELLVDFLRQPSG